MYAYVTSTPSWGGTIGPGALLLFEGGAEYVRMREFGMSCPPSIEPSTRAYPVKFAPRSTAVAKRATLASYARDPGLFLTSPRSACPYGRPCQSPNAPSTCNPVGAASNYTRPCSAGRKLADPFDLTSVTESPNVDAGVRFVQVV